MNLRQKSRGFWPWWWLWAIAVAYAVTFIVNSNWWQGAIIGFTTVIIFQVVYHLSRRTPS